MIHDYTDDDKRMDRNSMARSSMKAYLIMMTQAKFCHFERFPLCSYRWTTLKVHFRIHRAKKQKLSTHQYKHTHKTWMGEFMMQGFFPLLRHSTRRTKTERRECLWTLCRHELPPNRINKPRQAFLLPLYALFHLRVCRLIIPLTP